MEEKITVPGGVPVDAPQSEENINPLIRWIIHHDSSTLFNVLYIGLAIILSIWLGLFWLVAVVSVHGLLEILRQYLLSKNGKYALLETLWELKLDIGLIVFAFWLALYLDVLFGMAGLSAGARAVAQTSSRVARAGTRVAIWERIIRGVFITIDDLGLAFKFLAKRRQEAQGTSIVAEAVARKDFSLTSWRGAYTRGDWFSIGFLAFFGLLLVLAPWLTSQGVAQVWQIILMEMRPF